MATNRFYIFTLVILCLILGFLSYQILKPFLLAIAWAIVISILFYPVYAFLRKIIRLEPVASLITVIIVLLVILGPFSYLSFLLVTELKNATGFTESGVPADTTLKKMLALPLIANILDALNTAFNLENTDMEALITDNLRTAGKGLLGKITSGVADIGAALLNLVLMSFTLFFLLKDGAGFMLKIRDYLPFPKEQKDKLENQIKDMVISTIYGGVIVALAQGLVGGITLYFLGLQSAVLWGSSMAVMSFVPLLGTFTVWGPIAVYFLLKGSAAKAVILVVVGVFGISMIDNILKPIIIGGRTKMPTLIIFFSVLGGIKLFGFIGFVMGPMILALFISVSEILRNVEGGTHA